MKGKERTASKEKWDETLALWAAQELEYEKRMKKREQRKHHAKDKERDVPRGTHVKAQDNDVFDPDGEYVGSSRSILLMTKTCYEGLKLCSKVTERGSRKNWKN